MNIKSACLLLSLCQAGSAAALGLGDLTVRSYLGQPFHATVTLLDAAAETTADCFRLDAATTAGVASLQRALLSFERTRTTTLLHIRTPQSIHEPVAQFVLVADCEARLQRDYVVLLDPPPTLAAAEPAGAGSAPISSARVAPPPVPRAERLPRAAAANARQPRTPRARPAPTPAPRLVLSGRRMAGESGSAFALKLDTNLPDLTRTLPEGLTATELSDENTALNRKLAHLEAQLTALQQRNAELEARRARQASPTTATPPPSVKHPPQWPLFLLVAGMATGAGALILWLRARARARPAAGAFDDTWIKPDTVPAPLRETGRAAAADAQPAPVADPQAAERMPEIAQPTLAESTEVKDDILDQAEVYMAHGHANLAIHLLQEHLRDAPTESPVPWLLLLDLLHREGDTDGYAAASAECRLHFNVNLSDHPVSQDNDSGQGLEAYPHILEQLVHMWNSPERDAFFRDLIYDHRGGTRMGFRPAAYRDIILLRAIAQETPLANAA